ncbi:MAG TPA: YitT family protein [Desulfobacterales bacterium]|nr:MAG: YitT family protein [Deltaproteobacteria bacterium]HHC25098.1 YitT family protein [Desulfobacterales bacterium]
MKISLKTKLAVRDYVAISLGAFIMSLGVGVFLIDAKVVPGGVGGLAITAHYLSDYKIPVGLAMWVFNIPLFLWGLKTIGGQFGLRTFVGFSLYAFFLDLVRGNIPGLGFIRWQDIYSVQDMHQHDFVLSILCGAILLGVGLGIVFKFRGTTGGSDIVAAVMQKKFGWKPGHSFMLIDFFVISFAGLVIHYKGMSVDKPALTLTLYAFTLVFIASRIVDTIIEGFDYAKSALIISSKPQAVADGIVQKLSRGATALHGRGLYTNTERKIIYTVVTRKEITLLIDTIKAIDPNAFVIISNVHEVLGNGFRHRV